MTTSSNADSAPFLLLKPGVSTRDLEDRPGHLQLIADDEPTPIVLNDASFAVAREFDGTRTAEVIYEALRAEGLPVPSPDFVQALAETLVEHGLAELREEPLERPFRRRPPNDVHMVHPLQHECLGCGRSCQGHIFGPIYEGFIERADRIHAGLEEIYEDLVGLEPLQEVIVEHDEAPRVALNERGGQCIYLGEDGLCRIHKHYGSAAKPLVCRLFPLDVVQTEDGIRLGTPARCYFTHQLYNKVEPRTPSELTGIEMDDMPRPEPRGGDLRRRQRIVLNPRPGSLYSNTVRLEKILLHTLQPDVFTIEGALATFYRLLRGEELEPEGIVHQSAFGETLITRLQGFTESFFEAQPIIKNPPRPDTHYQQVHDLCTFFSGLSPRPFNGLTGPERDYISFALRTEVFLREWVNQPSLPAAFLGGLSGAIAASWRREDADDTPEEGEVSDTFGFSMTAWIRSVRTGDNFVRFLPGEPEFEALIDSIGAPATASA